MKKVSIALMVAAIAAVSFWAGSRFNVGPATGNDVSDQRQILYYTDPMNPGFRSNQPGVAPCGMPLEPVYADAGESATDSLSPGAVKIRFDRRQLIGVKLASVENQPLTYNLRLYGKVEPDETRVFRLNASTDSWIRELSDVTTGSYVRKGQVLAEALAPAFYNAQVTYLITMDNMDRIREQLGGELRHQQGDLANNQMRVAVQALQNLGITDEQVEELANTRRARPYLQVRSPTNGFILNRDITLNQWFKAGEEFYEVADLRKVWVYCDVYEDEAGHLRPGMTVQVKHSQLGKTFTAKVSEVLPLFDPVSKTLKVRLDIDNPQYDLRPDMFVDVEIPITVPAGIYISADAIVDTGTRSIVYVDKGDGVMEPRQIETGRKLGRSVEVVGGLMPGEHVVVSGNFLIDSESRMKTAASFAALRSSKDVVCGMDVPEEAAGESGRTVQYGGQVYYFCSQDCRVKFLMDMGAYVAGGESRNKENDTGDTTPGAKDLVCGMTVDELKSEYAGLFVKLNGESFHFCSPDCMKHFLKEPGKFLGGNTKISHEQAAKGGKPTAHSADTGEETPAHRPKPQVTHEEIRWDKPTDGAMRKRSMTPGIVDWDGPEKDKEVKNWKGWGKFPGSQYLGMKESKAKAQPQSISGDDQKPHQADPDPQGKAHHEGDAAKGALSGQ